jgi:threonine/homoserine/homoserine lactone efflux protein
VTPVRPLRAVRDGFVVGAANPKTIVFFVVGLPEFTTAGTGPPGLGRRDWAARAWPDIFVR